MTVDPSGWIPNLLGVIELQASGVVVTNPRPKLNFSGAEYSDDGERITITFPGAAEYDEKVVAWLEDPSFANLQDAVTGSDIATTSTAQTVTTKTISADDNTITCASGAAGDLLVHNGTKFVRLAKGSANQVLRVNAGATALEWAAPSGGVSVSGTGLVTVTGGAIDGAAFTLGTNVPAWLATPSSANLAAAITDETGSGALVFGTSPTFKASLIVRNPADTFGYTLTPAAIAANRTLNLPLLTGTDTIVTEAHPQTVSGKTYGDMSLTRQAVSTTGTINDLAVNATTSLLVFTGAGAVTLTSIVAPSGCRLLYVSNRTGDVLTLAQETGATPANRFDLRAETDTLINNQGGAVLVYDTVAQRWTAVAVHA